MRDFFLIITHFLISLSLSLSRSCSLIYALIPFSHSHSHTRSVEYSHSFSLLFSFFPFLLQLAFLQQGDIDRRFAYEDRAKNNRKLSFVETLFPLGTPTRCHVTADKDYKQKTWFTKLSREIHYLDHRSSRIFNFKPRNVIRA